MLQQANDIRTFRIQSALDKIIAIELVALPPDNKSPFDVIELLRLTKLQTKKATAEMNALSLSIFTASNEYLNLLLREFDAYVAQYNLEARIVEEMKIRHAMADTQDSSGEYF
ncbi:unnamed protein product [Protopolystoma xenopodis]|uniref:Dynein heavy chain tail domain-containing protein n=1 Tax=Protopolystoma xenopodis TaxID=117903 RepID=A0A448XH72_9PLAT|nr:unnamed protein product [Protopolystoma xenopodis]